MDGIRLTPAYSLKIVNEILESQDKKQRVFDPFSGTNTLVLCAVMKVLLVTEWTLTHS